MISGKSVGIGDNSIYRGAQLPALVVALKHWPGEWWFRLTPGTIKLFIP